MVDGELRSALQLYKELTIKLIDALEQEDYDALEGLLSQRQLQIDSIDGIEYSKEEFTDICKELEILLLQDKLTKFMNVKRAEVRAELDGFNKGKSANVSYRNRGSIDSIYFNKKI